MDTGCTGFPTVTFVDIMELTKTILLNPHTVWPHLLGVCCCVVGEQSVMFVCLSLCSELSTLNR